MAPIWELWYYDSLNVIDHVYDHIVIQYFNLEDLQMAKLKSPYTIQFSTLMEGEKTVVAP